MEFTDLQLDRAIEALGSVSGVDYSAMTSAPNAEMKRAFIGTTMGAIVRNRTGGAAQPADPTQFDPSVRTPSKRQQIAQSITQSLGGQNVIAPAHLEGLMMAQIIESGRTGNFDFIKMDGVISADERTFLEGIAREYGTDTPAIDASFATASGNYAERERLRLEAEARAAQQQQEATMRTADIKAIQAGLREQGFYDGEITGQSSPQLAQALYDYSVKGHLGLQNGDAAAYAIEKYGSGNIQVQLAAAIQNGEIGDAALGREMVAAGLRGRPLDFQADFTSGDPARITQAEAIAHALNPRAGIQIDGILDNNAIGVAGAHTSAAFQGIPATLIDYRGNVNYAALEDAAKRGTLPGVPAEHLGDTERQTLDLLGGMETEQGRMYMANLIDQKGAEWYRGGLELAHKAQEPVVVRAQEITPRSMVLNPVTDTSPEVIAGIDIYNDTPAPQDLPADAPQDVRDLAQAKLDYFNAQQRYGDPATGNFRAGTLGPGGFDRGLAVSEFYAAEDRFLNLLDDVTGNPERMASVQRYLAELKSRTPGATPDATPDATPGVTQPEETPAAVAEATPALPQSTATFHVDGTPELPTQSTAAFNADGTPVLPTQSTPQLTFGADGMPVFADTSQPILFSGSAERGIPLTNPLGSFDAARMGNPLDGHAAAAQAQDPALAEALARKFGGQSVAFAPM